MLTYKAARSCAQPKNTTDEFIALLSGNYPDKFDKAVLIAIASKMDSSELEEMAPLRNNSFESENKER